MYLPYHLFMPRGCASVVWLTVVRCGCLIEDFFLRLTGVLSGSETVSVLLPSWLPGLAFQGSGVYQNVSACQAAMCYPCR